MLAKILNGRVVEFIPKVDPAFPSIPLKKRFSKEFLNGCVECPEGIELGYMYENGEFSAPKPDPEKIDIPIKDADPTVRQKLEELEGMLKSIVTIISKDFDLSEILKKLGGDK